MKIGLKLLRKHAFSILANFHCTTGKGFNTQRRLPRGVSLRVSVKGNTNLSRVVSLWETWSGGPRGLVSLWCRWSPCIAANLGHSADRRPDPVLWRKGSTLSAMAAIRVCPRQENNCSRLCYFKLRVKKNGPKGAPLAMHYYGNVKKPFIMSHVSRTECWGCFMGRQILMKIEDRS